MGMLGLGVVLNGFLAFRTKSHGPGPHIWWTGIPVSIKIITSYSFLHCIYCTIYFLFYYKNIWSYSGDLVFDMAM